MVVPEIALPLNARGHPKACGLCADRFETRYGLPVSIMHADLIPGMVGFRIFQAMPKRVRFKAALAGCMGKGEASPLPIAARCTVNSEAAHAASEGCQLYQDWHRAEGICLSAASYACAHMYVTCQS